MAHRLPLILAVLLTAPLAIGADDYYQAWRWSHLGTEEGLPTETVLAVEESSDSTLWVGLRSGVAWFDGYRFTALGPEHGVPDQPVGSLAPLTGGQMALTIEGALYTGGRDGFVLAPLPFAIYSVGAGESGRLALLSREMGVFLWQDGEVVPIPLPPQLTPRDVLGVSSSRGTVWLRTQTGSFRLVDRQWVAEQRERNLKHLATTPDGRRYGSADLPLGDRGLWSWEPGRPLVRHAEEVTDLIRIIEAGPGNRVVVVFESGAVLTRHGGAWASLEPAPQAMRDVLGATYRSNGDLALATSHGLRLYRASSRHWQRWYMPGGGARNRIDEILETANGDVWLGTDGGVEVRHRDGRISWFDEVLGQPLRIVTALGEDNEGGVWVGSGAYWAGAFRYHEGQWRFYGADEGMEASRIHRIHRDREGRLYFLGLSGAAGSTRRQEAVVATYYRGHLGRFEVEPRLATERLHSMAQTPDGAIWLSGELGIGRFLNNSWTYWTTAEGLRHSGIFTMAADARGQVYFADRRHGLGRLDLAGHVEYFDASDGLIHDQVWDLAVDGDDRAWAATRGGLSSLLDGMWTNYGSATGLEALELWPVMVGETATLVGSAGNGTFILDRETTAPPVRVYFEPSLVTEDRVVVRWKPLSFDGRMPSDRIQTRLALDEGPWSAWSRSREVVLSGLTPGPHTVRVQGAGPAGNYIEGGFTTQFHVPASLYSRPVFFLPVGISVLAVCLLSVALATRRRRHAVDMAVSEDRYRSFFEQAPISLWEQDFSEVRAYLARLNLPDETALREHLRARRRAVFDLSRRVRILDANQATLQLFGCDSLETMVGQLHRIFRRDSHAAFAEGMVALHRGDTRFLRDTVAYTLQGTPLHVVLNWAVAPGSEVDYERILVSVLDVTPQRRAAEELRQAARVAEEANRAKSAFLANTSHEIRTPINAVMGMAQALQEEALSFRAAEQVGTILQASEALTEVIDDLLDLSKIEAGQLELETLTYDPVETARAACRTLEARAADKGIALSVTIDAGTVRSVDGDRVRLRQVLLNLLGNAIKFTASGSVELRLRSAVEEGGVRLCFEVTDTGMGIPADRLEHIFEPFTQADASVTRTHGGTGLGLSISKRLVEMMGGHIAAESLPGAGSAFSFDVLAAPGSGRVLEQASEAPEAGRPLDILLVEDNALNRKVVHALLRRDAHRITEVENGALAVDAVRSGQTYDVILMDMQMPVMDGLAATETIRQHEAEIGRAWVPIIALTANAMQGDRERCLAAGMNDFLAKPVRKEQLRAALARIESSGAAGPPGPGPQVRQPDTSILDPAPLDELRDLAELDDDLTLTGFIGEFLDDAVQVLRRARQALAEGDTEALQRQVHTLKGNSRQLGAAELGNRAESLEQEIKDGAEVDVGARLDQLQLSLERAAELLEEVARNEERQSPE